uniref:Small ribosomal subunit protein uS19m n=1 Tax=Micromonas pusilla (strain CCMP1545) TaxID=564608 RepID=C1KR89_MICPC|nr:ribosomal protein S19 [Micromonas pusilla CCMP1545]
MTRSLWKVPFVDPSILGMTHGKTHTVWSRRSTIIPQCVGQQILVHNGTRFVRVTVSSDMVGHKFGEFAVTRKKNVHKKKTKKKK